MTRVEFWMDAFLIGLRAGFKCIECAEVADGALEQLDERFEEEGEKENESNKA